MGDLVPETSQPDLSTAPASWSRKAPTRGAQQGTPPRAPNADSAKPVPKALPWRATGGCRGTCSQACVGETAQGQTQLSRPPALQLGGPPRGGSWGRREHSLVQGRCQDVLAVRGELHEGHRRVVVVCGKRGLRRGSGQGRAEAPLAAQDPQVRPLPLVPTPPPACPRESLLVPVQPTDPCGAITLTRGLGEHRAAAVQTRVASPPRAVSHPASASSRETHTPSQAGCQGDANHLGECSQVSSVTVLQKICKFL